MSAKRPTLKSSTSNAVGRGVTKNYSWKWFNTGLENDELWENLAKSKSEKRLNEI